MINGQNTNWQTSSPRLALQDMEALESIILNESIYSI